MLFFTILQKVFNNLHSEYTKKILIICSVFESELPYLRDERINGGIYKNEVWEPRRYKWCIIKIWI